jgi:hypothetical protein
VLDFLATNCEDVIDEVSFNDVPGHLMKDLLVATARGKKKAYAEVAFDNIKDGYCADGLKVLSVSELRVKLDEMGLDVDGSREAMIKVLKSHSDEESSDDEDDGEASFVEVHEDEENGVE